MMALKSAFASLVALSACVCSANLYESVSDLPRSLDAYDYVIVGGGLAGSVVANRLTEDNDTSVLLLEAGPSHHGVFVIEVPGLQTYTNPGSIWNWNYTSIPQVTLDNRTIPAPRGHVLGGSSSIHGMWYTRGSSADYDRWANVTGDPGWSWDQIQYYFKKSEKFTQPVDGHNTTGQYNPALHGTKGPLAVTLYGYNQSLDELVMGSLDAEFPFIEDYEDGEPIGFGWTQTTILDGARASSATSYLDPFLERPGLDVLVNALVTKVTSSTGETIDTVVFSQPGNATTLYASPKVEVIISAGSINTPQLLLNSGIGNATELKALNITPFYDLPSVGKNLTEHPAVANVWNTSGTAISNPYPLFEAAVAQWNATHTGHLSMAVGNTVGWVRMNLSDPAVAAFVAEYGDPAPGPNSPHIELLPTNSAFDAIQNFADAQFILDAVNLVPKSRGSITLNASDPLGAPLIDYAFYTAPEDILVMREALLSAFTFVNSSAWAAYLTAPASTELAAVLAAVQSNSSDVYDLMDAYIRATTSIAYHIVGTCALAPAGADWGVVDPDFHVKGVKGLRVVDSSVMPFVPAAHTQAAVYAIAERASDIIKGVISVPSAQ